MQIRVILTFIRIMNTINQRDLLRKHLSGKGIGTLIQWSGSPIHQFENLKFNEILPETDSFFKKCFMLPLNTVLDDAEVDYVIKNIREFYGMPS